LSLSSIGDIGTLGVPSAGGELRFSAMWPHWRFETAAVVLAPRDVTAPAQADVLATVGPLMTVDARGCFAKAFGPIEAAACLGIAGGVLLEMGADVRAQRAPVTAPWLAAIASLEGRWVMSTHWSLRAAVDVGAAIVAPKFVVFGCSNCDFGAGPALGRLVFGPEVRFP
jgi:hypothetical protein